ncbi:MAG: hypothetical protein LDL41_17045, partial [Coleofasciculus sp. S288]|nr:hypothetical protein [Coleofasciculus sp. S288]
TIKLWNGDGTLLKTLKLHPDTDKVRSASFSHDGKMLASASYDYTVILWDLNQWNADLDVLLVRGCDWARDYLKNNPNVQESDRTLCDDIPTPPSPPSESEYFLRNINLFNSGCCKNG